MNSASLHLHSEDRHEYERLLDETLRSVPNRPDLAAVGQRLNPEQLRTMALNATALITAAAATEYQHYVRIREELRYPMSPYQSSRIAYPASSSGSAPASAPSAPPPSDSRSVAADHQAPAGLGGRLGAAILGAGHPGGRRIRNGVAPHRWARMSYGRRLLATVLGLHVRPEAPKVAATTEVRTPRPLWQPTVVRGTGSTERDDPSTMGLAATVGEVSESTRTSAGAIVAVLAPVLAGTLAAIFLIIGYVLKLLTPERTITRTILTTGWIFGAVTAAALLVAAVSLLLTALRATPSPKIQPYGELNEEVARAREAWREALLERGILPFLRDALADPSTADWRRTAPTTRMPQLGYHRPSFTSPHDPRRRSSSPDLSSPDFGGPEHQPE
ncbi:hypothetical protein [Streptomyces sp. enrichment culture]|uniref:hypothetical protein n=1 Tax=Streptomyces sp. enrichment culture TaxID=1795815 RepID=UPI003F5581C1